MYHIYTAVLQHSFSDKFSPLTKKNLLIRVYKQFSKFSFLLGFNKFKFKFKLETKNFSLTISKVMSLPVFAHWRVRGVRFTDWDEILILEI